MTISSKPNITILWADQGSYEAPDDAKILQGWVAEIPPYESQNWWQHRADEALKHIFEAGIAVWDANTLYTANRSIVQSSDGVLWRALIDNTGQNPLSSGAWTRLIQETRYVPAGMIAEFATTAPPTGYLVCDGTPKSRAAYPDLFAAIGTTWGVGDGSTTFNIPDFRGVFRRGWDNGRGLDPSRVFGSTQTSQNIQHGHTGTTNDNGVHGHSGVTDGAGHHTHSGTTSVAADHVHPRPAGDGFALTGAAGVNNNGTATGLPPASPSNIGFGSAWSNVSTTGGAGAHQHSLAIDAGGGHQHGLAINTSGNHNHIFSTNNSGGSEARPINVSVLVCIKF